MKALSETTEGTLQSKISVPPVVSGIPFPGNSARAPRHDSIERDNCRNEVWVRSRCRLLSVRSWSWPSQAPETSRNDSDVEQSFRNINVEIFHLGARMVSAWFSELTDWRSKLPRQPGRPTAIDVLLQISPAGETGFLQCFQQELDAKHPMASHRPDKAVVEVGQQCGLLSLRNLIVLAPHKFPNLPTSTIRKHSSQ